jgi:hypothetical protein
MKHLIKRKRKIVHANVSCDYMHTIQMDYVDAIDMWDAARWVGRVRWVEVWVKKFGGGGRPGANLQCETTTKSTPPLGLSSWT